MNPTQMALQIRHVLQQAVWPGGSGDEVFGTQYGRVEMYAGSPSEEDIAALTYPCALVVMGDGTSDDEENELIEQGFRIIIGASVHGTTMGSHAITGGPIADVGKSANRGVSELLTRVRAEVTALSGADGATMQLVGQTLRGPFNVGQSRHLAFAELQLSAWCTTELYYAPPQEVAESGGTLTWSGGDLNGSGHCASRFDFKQYRVFAESGTTPSSDPVSNGTLLATATSANASGATSGNVYSVFADYNLRDATGAVVGTSASVIGSWVAKA